MIIWFAACVNEYFNDAVIEETPDQSTDEDPICKGFKSVLDSKSNDETMVILLPNTFFLTNNFFVVIIFMIHLSIIIIIFKSSYYVFSVFGNGIEQALHASWEPRHSRHCYIYPWQQYVKLGAVLRQFGYTVVALHGCLRTEIQVTKYNYS